MNGWAKIPEACRYAGLKPRTFRGLLRRGLRHSRLPSGTVLIKYEWIDEFFAAYEFKPGESEIDRIVEETLKDLAGKGKVE